jgi:hypothetical protein
VSPQLPTPNLLVQKKAASARVKRLEKGFAVKVEALKSWHSAYQDCWENYNDMKRVMKEKRNQVESLEKQESLSAAEMVDLVTLKEEMTDLHAAMGDGLDDVEHAKEKVGNPLWIIFSCSECLAYDDVLDDVRWRRREQTISRSLNLVRQERVQRQLLLGLSASVWS